jgi:Icc-related predicted phosphoesterase
MGRVYIATNRRKHMGKALSRRGWFALLVLAVALDAACRRISVADDIRFTEGRHFAVVSDLQRDMLWDQGFVPSETNDAERVLIIGEIAKRRPGLVAISGDLVGDGSSQRHWADLDDLLRPLREAKIPVVAAIGNHDYLRTGRRNLDQFFARFPYLAGRHWYSVGYGCVSIVVLDSNRDALTESEWKEQESWFDLTLRRLDGDARVRGMVVMLHHPPYTNSTVTGDETDVQEAFVPAFNRSRKTMAMISGHVHSYERFVRGAKAFIVSGGVGIPRAPLLESEKRRHTDDLFAGPAVRTFHFLDFAVNDGGIDVQVISVAPPSVMDTFTLRWP